MYIFFFFSNRSDYSDDCIPKSNYLKLIANSEQVLSSIAARRLLTYEKIKEPDTDDLEIIDNIRDDFRPRFFAIEDADRLEKKMQREELKVIGRQEALKRGKVFVEKDK